MFFPINGDSYRASVITQVRMTGANNSTTFFDYAPTPLTYTAYNSAKISTAQSKFGGGSGYFDNSTGVVKTTIPAIGTSDFTVEFWIYPLSDGGNTTAQVIRIGTDSAFQGGLWINKNTGSSPMRMQARIYASSDGFHTVGTESENTEAPNDTWTHFALCRSGTTFRFFRNGTLASTVTDGNANANNLTETEFCLGNDPSLNAPFYGYLQDLRVTRGVARYVTSFGAPTDFSTLREADLSVRKTSQPSFGLVARAGI